jgi:hypothetical protein
MAHELDPNVVSAVSRMLGRNTPIAVPVREIEWAGGVVGGIAGVGGIGGQREPVESLPRTTVYRPGDLLRIEFRFLNLDRLEDVSPPVLARRDSTKPAYLVAVLGPQHLLEQVFFDPAGTKADFERKTEVPPLEKLRDHDPGAPETPKYPVKARIARPSRIAYTVTDQRIVFTTDGLLHAMRVLPLSVVPHAEGASPIIRWEELADNVGAIKSVAKRLQGIRADVDKGAAELRTPALVGLAEAVQLRRTAAQLEARFGPASAVAAVNTDVRVGIEIGPLIPIDVRPPAPRAPTSTETALEIPWRLQLSPHSRGAFAHALDEVDHDGRVELWHSRLATRTDAAAELDPATAPPLDEEQSATRTVRAVWTRDFASDSDIADRSDAFPQNEDFGDLTTLPPFRATLSVRDRMQLVHLTSNHRYPKYRPRPASVERLMVTAAGGWLALEAHFDPTGAGLSIEEWRHRATLGRDHYVKVVYQGVLLPFGHRASLVKVTERRVKSDGHATLYQRLFIVVRQPERRFLTAGSNAYDNRMPLRWVRILTAETPPLAAPRRLLDNAGGQIFVPEIATDDGPAGKLPGAEPFRFRFLANDISNRLVEFEGPAVFVEKTVFDGSTAKSTREAALQKANDVDTTYPLLGQRIAYAPPLDPDDTTLATERIRFDALFDTRTADKGTNFVLPVMRVAHAPVPAMSAFTGQTQAQALTYATAYIASGVGPGAHPGNQGGLFLQLSDDLGVAIKPTDAVTMGFSTQSQKSGGFVSPSVSVTALARRVGPVGGDLNQLAASAGSFDVGKMFGLDAAKLFGILPLAELLPSGGSPLPAFATKSVNAVLDLGSSVAEARLFLSTQSAQLAAHGPAVKAAADDLEVAAEAVAVALEAVLAPPHPPQPFDVLLVDLGNAARTLVTQLREITTAAGAPGAGVGVGLGIPRPELERAFGLFDRLADLAAEAGPIAQAIQAFATGTLLPERVSARLEWTTELEPWAPAGVSPPVFQPEGDKQLRLVAEVQAPLRGGTPTTLVSCALPPFTLTLLGDTQFIAIHVVVMEFSVQPGRKTDVNVALSDGKDGRPSGIEFLGPLAFVETLKEIIPFDGFSDPPYLDIQPSGLKAGFDLQIPDLAVGIFALSNIHVGAELSVPFIGESLEFRFFFATRENPFRLQVAFFAGGGFFAITISPKGLKVIEAAFEFGAAVEMSFVVASGSLSVMAGIYFRLEIEGESQAVQLTGYFRARGEVDVLGLISACIELYLELSYRSVGGASKAVGKASISIEVSVCFLSFSVSVTCEKQFAGSSGDPTFLETMGQYVDHRGTPHDAWAEYCDAFGVEAM